MKGLSKRNWILIGGVLVLLAAIVVTIVLVTLPKEPIEKHIKIYINGIAVPDDAKFMIFKKEKGKDYEITASIIDETGWEDFDCTWETKTMYEPHSGHWQTGNPWNAIEGKHPTESGVYQYCLHGCNSNEVYESRDIYFILFDENDKPEISPFTQEGREYDYEYYKENPYGVFVDFEVKIFGMTIGEMDFELFREGEKVSLVQEKGNYEIKATWDGIVHGQQLFDPIEVTQHISVV